MVDHAPVSRPVLIPHVDDVGGSHGSNVAMVELAAAGTLTSGSVMVPSGWFPEIALEAADRDLDLGVHLTLTSESVRFRWRPISTTSPASGLIDPDGYMWPTVPQLRAHADPDAVEGELRAQIEAAIGAGIDVSHLDHHMGAALSPEFVAGTVRIAEEYGLPTLFPRDLDGYLAVLNMGEVDVEVLAEARAELGELAVADRFLMPLVHQGRPDTAAILRDELANLPAGVTYLSLHCAAPGDIEAIHPEDAAWRIGEYRAFGDPDFRDWLTELPIELAGMRRPGAAAR